MEQHLFSSPPVYSGGLKDPHLKINRAAIKKTLLLWACRKTFILPDEERIEGACVFIPL